MEELRIDMRKLTPEQLAESKRQNEILFCINHTLQDAEEYGGLVKELFAAVGEGSHVLAPMTIVHGDKVQIGRNVIVMPGSLMMAAGTITIEDDVQVAANVQLISNNHDFYDRQILLCKPVVLKRGCWVGAGSTILAGVTVGEHAVVGAGSVVTKDVERNTVVAGNPARVVRVLEDRP